MSDFIAFEKMEEHAYKTEAQRKPNKGHIRYFVKVVYPGIYHHLDDLTMGLSIKLYNEFSSCLYSEQHIFLYVISPVKRIIGMAEILGEPIYQEKLKEWPYEIPLEMVMGPKKLGVSFSEVGLNISRQEDFFPISELIANRIVTKLNRFDNPNLTYEDLKYLKNLYIDNYRR